jgi:hypothetical protein
MGGMALLGAGLGCLAQAQAQPQAAAASPLGRVGVFALLGDTVQATWAENAPDVSRIERTGRETLDFKGIGFDLIALRIARTALGTLQPKPSVDLFNAPAPLTLTDQRALAEGARRAELPAWMVKTIADNRLTHLLLVTRGRGTMLAETGSNEAIGRGTVEGIGFYLDTLYTMQNTRTGALSTGLLAPYVQIRLQLMDVQSGDIVSDYAVRDSFAYASPDTKPEADPWNFMPNTDKVRTLRGMVEKGLTRGMQQLLARQ